jgi:hypothetical protein
MFEFQNSKRKSLAHLNLGFEIYFEFGICDLEFAHGLGHPSIQILH